MHLKQRFAALFFLVLPPVLWALNGGPGVAFSAGSVGAARQAQLVQSVVGQVSKDEFLDLDKRLSGALPATVGGQEVVFQTRYTPSEQGTLAEQYVYEYFQSLGLTTSYHAWSGGPQRCSNVHGRNVRRDDGLPYGSQGQVLAPVRRIGDAGVGEVGVKAHLQVYDRDASLPRGSQDPTDGWDDSSDS